MVRHKSSGDLVTEVTSGSEDSEVVGSIFYLDLTVCVVRLLFRLKVPVARISLRDHESEFTGLLVSLVEQKRCPEA